MCVCVCVCVCVSAAPVVNVSDYSQAAGAGENGPSLELNSDSKVRKTLFITVLSSIESALEQQLAITPAQMFTLILQHWVSLLGCLIKILILVFLLSPIFFVLILVWFVEMITQANPRITLPKCFVIHWDLPLFGDTYTAHTVRFLSNTRRNLYPQLTRTPRVGSATPTWPFSVRQRPVFMASISPEGALAFLP